MKNAKLSSKNQMTLPREARELLGVKAGDEILLVPRNGHILLMRKPESIAKALYGIGKGMYLPDADTYLKRERASWDRRKSTRR